MVVLIPDHCLSIYFTSMTGRNSSGQYLFYKQESEIRFISVAVKRMHKSVFQNSRHKIMSVYLVMLVSLRQQIKRGT